MSQKPDILKNENGFILVTALMILIVLVLVGITATNTSFIEMLISGNSRFQKQAFFQADGGTEAAINLTYENALCLNAQDGFQLATAGDPFTLIDGNIRVMSASLALADPVRDPVALPLTDANRDAVYYTEGIINDNAPHTNLAMSGDSVMTWGTGQSQISGYLGLGFGAAGGGTDILYAMNSQHVGVANSQADVSLEWRMSGFLVNSASSFDCRY